jgi:hypothetical protein
MKKTFLLFVMAATLTGCSVYHPQSVDIPLISHQGEVKVDGSLGMSASIAFVDAVNMNLTASAGLNDWLAAQVHANYGGDNYYMQVAPGYYHQLGEKSVMECYAGVGFGGSGRDKVSANESSSSLIQDYNFDGHYVLPFMQGNIGWHDLTAAHIDLGFGMKVGAFMPDYRYQPLDKNGVEIASETTNYTTTNLLLEPQVIVRFGLERVRFNVKMGFAWLNDVTVTLDHFNYDWFTLSGGLTFVF